MLKKNVSQLSTIFIAPSVEFKLLQQTKICYREKNYIFLKNKIMNTAVQKAQ